MLKRISAGITFLLIFTTASGQITPAEVPHKKLRKNPAPPRRDLHEKEFADSAFAPDIQYQFNEIYYLAMNRTNAPAFSVGISVMRQLEGGWQIVQVDSGAALKNLSRIFKYLVPANHNWKLSPQLENQATPAGMPETMKYFTVVTRPGSDFTGQLEKQGWKSIIRESRPEWQTYKIFCTPEFLSLHILPLRDVIFADLSGSPKVEFTIGNYDLSTNKINMVHALYPGLTGQGYTASIKENRFDTADLDLLGRYAAVPGAPIVVNSHATIMATLIGGAGNSFYSGRGAASAVRLTSSSFDNLLPDDTLIYRQFNIAVQNHSYGTGVENYYGAEARAFDALAAKNNFPLFVFSAGNSGTITPGSGNYAGIPATANLTGNFKMAKNVLTVGAIDSSGKVETLSSRGPAYDGRVKPELVAFGEDGSSGAAALASGVAVLLRNAGVQNDYFTKAVMINSADDIGTPGPDFASGFGSINAQRAVEWALVKRTAFQGSVGEAQTLSFNFTVPAGTGLLKLTLLWPDPPAILNSPTALMNDLDLTLEGPGAGSPWLPWVLSHFPNTDSLQAPAVRRKDSRNTIEQISLANPAAGNYTIRVKGTTFLSGSASQPFVVVYDMLPANRFQWQFPSRGDNFLSGNNSLARWDSDLSGSGDLYFSKDAGSNWQLVQSGVDLSKGSFKWNAPDTFTLGRLRMNIGASSFTTDTFTLSKPLRINVGYNCPDSFLLYWNKISGINQYQLFSMNATGLQQAGTVTDSVAFLAKNNPALSQLMAVAPLLGNGFRGLRSSTFNYTEQGVACYIRTFLADLQTNNTVDMSADLGTAFRVQRIAFQRLLPDGGFTTLATVSPISSLLIRYTDPSPKKGVNYYRAAIGLENGRNIYSEWVAVYVLGDADFYIYPNPAAGASNITLVSKNIDNSEFTLYNASGATVLQIRIIGYVQSIRLPALAGGVYSYRITSKGKTEGRGQLVVQ